MAKSDSFFIRAQVNAGQAAGYAETPINLGSYVDALGKSVLRIHNIAPTYSDSNGRSPDVDATSDAAAQFQLTTQTQSGIITPLNKSVVSSGQINCRNSDSSAGVAGFTSESFDNAPQLWTNGYLIAVDQMYLGGSASTGFNEDVYITLVMECTVETMSKEAAMALSLSQQ